MVRPRSSMVMKILMFYGFTFLLFDFVATVVSSYFAVKSRWVLDEAASTRVKLAYVNLVSHLEPMVTEELNRQPLKNITRMHTAQKFHSFEDHILKLVDFHVCKAFLGNLIQRVLGFSVVSSQCQVSAYPCIQERH